MRKKYKRSIEGEKRRLEALRSPETRKKISDALKGKDPKNRKFLYTAELNEKRRKKLTGISRPQCGLKKEKHWNWKKEKRRNCIDCGKSIERHSELRCSNCRYIYLANLFSQRKGIKSPNWKGKNITYSAFHHWIRKTFGKACKCDNRTEKILSFVCSKKSNTFNWALKKGKKYSRKKENYYMLCKSCHSIYDKKT